MNTIQDIEGVTLARAVVHPDGKVSLTLFAPSGFSGTHYYPAESLSFDEVEAIEALHSITGKMLDAIGLARSNTAAVGVGAKNQVPYEPVPGSVTDFRLKATSSLGEPI